MASGGRRFFLVERYVPSISAESVAAAARRLSGTTDGPTRHVCTLLVRDEETCLSVFEAPNAEAVADANDRAGFPLDRIVEVELFADVPPAARSRASLPS
jgi:hypothetical protein